MATTFHTKPRALSGARLALLAGCAALPCQLAQGQASVSLHGVVRDFNANHPDFELASLGGDALITGSVAVDLDFDGKPVYTGDGRVVATDALDSEGRPIPPHLAGGFSEDPVPMEDFGIANGLVIPNQEFVAVFTVLGAAIETSGGSPMPVTLRVRTDADVHEPFGPYSSASATVNDENNPRRFDAPGAFAPGTELSIQAKSWYWSRGRYRTHLSANSADDSPQVRVLRDGDAVPNYAGFNGQNDIEHFVRDYIDTDRGTISLLPHQAIFLFELGTTNLTSIYTDFQDLVVLVTLTTSLDHIGGVLDPGIDPCNALNDSDAAMGSPTNGRISGQDSFAQWFRHWPGVNAPAAYEMVLTDNGAGVFEYSTADFTPIDKRLFGNAGSDHNRNLTFEVDALFTGPGQCEGRFIEVSGEGDLWMYIDGKLAMDFSGNGANRLQYLSFDRLGLVEGTEYKLQLFYAQRADQNSPLSVRTNLNLRTTGPKSVPVASFYD